MRIGVNWRERYAHYPHQLNENKEDTHAAELTSAEISNKAMLAIGAGSETTATALSNAMYYLTMYPDVFARLRAEVDEAAGTYMPFDQLLAPDRLANLHNLQAVFNETLRLQSAIPNGVQRTSPKDRSVILAGK